ncbi:MAG: hypothetical protein ACPGVB_14845 [Chitinophagales bacterium]
MVNTIDVQYVTDTTDKQTAVLVPIETWKEISERLPTLLQYITLRESLMEGFKEVRRIQRGEQEAMSLEEFFNELKN